MPCQSAGLRTNFTRRVRFAQRARSASRGALIAATAALALLGGCPQPGSTTPTAKEGTSVQAVRFGSSALAQALGMLQVVAGDGSVRVALSGSARPTAADSDIVFGECPIVTLGGGGSIAFTLDVAFPSKCAPLGHDDYQCVGSAGGTFNAFTQTIELAFNPVSCNEKSLGGDAIVSYSLSGDTIVLTGEWKLSLNNGDEIVATDGAGSATYDKSQNALTINSFAGKLTRSGVTFNVILADIVVSYENNANLIPSSGSAAITAAGMRDVTVYFDSESPATGLVQMRLGVGDPFTVDLNSL